MTVDEEIFKQLKTVHPLLLRKWNRAYAVFFDVDGNGMLEWEDFEYLIWLIGEHRGKQSDDFKTATVAMKEIWRALVSEADIDKDDKVDVEEWQLMLLLSRDKKGQSKWQQMYLEYMFKLLDAGSIECDSVIDLSEYIEVMGFFGVDKNEAEESFDKFARDSEGQNLFAIDYAHFCRLWTEFFESTDEESPGNYLFGDLNSVFNDLKKVDPFLVKKWTRAFSIFFDLDKNEILEWEDFQYLIWLIGKHRGFESNEYLSARTAMKEIWCKLVSEADMDEDDRIDVKEWQLMWYRMRQKGLRTEGWQKLYLDYMFTLLDASSDAVLDMSEYIEVMGIFGIEKEEAMDAFDRFARDSDGQNLFAIDYDRYCNLWKEFFESTDPDAPGNYLFGDIDADA